MQPKAVMRIAIMMILLLSGAACNLPGGPTPTPSSVTPQGPPTESSDPLASPGPALGEPTQAPTPDSGELAVVYTSEANLYLWSEGLANKLTDSGEAYRPRVSPDGSLIAFMRPADDFHLEIWCVDRDGGNERRLVSVSDMDTIAGGVRDSSAVAVNPFADYGWIPGTRKLAFTSQQVFQGPGLNLLNDLTIVDADTLEFNYLLGSGWGGEFTISPDGSMLAITQPDKIILANIDGSDYRTVLPYEPVITYSEYRYYAKPIWSQDSKYLMVAIPPVDPLAAAPQTTELWRLNTDGSPAELLGGVQAVAFMEQPVVFSPDLQRVAYLTGPQDQNTRELHLASIDGTGDWTYAQASPLVFQSWSPDSVHFIYSVGPDQETWVGSLQESPRALAPAFLGGQTVLWTSDEQFLFWSPGEAAFELSLGALDGGIQRLDTVFGSPPDVSIIQ